MLDVVNKLFVFGSADPKQNMIAEWAQISLRYLYEEAIPLNETGKSMGFKADFAK